MADDPVRCRGWRQEAILRLLENNLAIAEDPEDLVVYAAHAKAARDHQSLRAIVTALSESLNRRGYCAVHPAMRPHAKIGVNSSPGKPRL